jgi:hypothetical protein
LDAWYDGVDSDCAGNDDYDADADGYQSTDYGGEDCDDLTSTTYPGASDAWYDGVDSDCAGNDDYDSDADGYSSADYGGDDCNDSDSTVSPAGSEVCDSVDNDCDSEVDEDVCFTDATFTNCNGNGYTGPTDCSSDYSGTELDGAVSLSAGIQSWTIPATTTYYFGAYGAQGASGDGSYVGGRGAWTCAAFTLSAGDVVQIVVGQKGSGQSSGSNGGGGGGTFVVRSDNTPLLIAGGGGGTRTSVSQNGCDATTSEYGTTGSGGGMTHSCSERGGSPGYGGAVSSGSWGSGGAGFYGDGYDDYSDGRGRYWGNGMIGGPGGGGCGDSAQGGFGGGGSGRGCYGGGGGGGYSGGEGGRVAGGGGSFVDSLGFGDSSASGVQEGDGLLVVSTEGCSL